MPMINLTLNKVKSQGHNTVPTKRTCHNDNACQKCGCIPAILQKLLSICLFFVSDRQCQSGKKEHLWSKAPNIKYKCKNLFYSSIRCFFSLARSTLLPHPCTHQKSLKISCRDLFINRFDRITHASPPATEHRPFRPPA